MSFARAPVNLARLMVGASVLLVTCFVQDRIRGLGADTNALIPSPPQYIGLTIDVRIIQRLLGIRLAVADLIWLDALIKSDTVHEKDSYTSVYKAFKAATFLDPDNLPVYYVAGTYLSVVKDDVHGATSILREGVQHMQSHAFTWHGAWQVPFMLGYNLIFEEHELEEGSRWVGEAAKFEHAPAAVKKLAQTVSTERGQLEVASRILNDIYRKTEKADERAKIERKLLAIASKQDLVELNERFEVFRRSTGAYAFSKEKQLHLFLKEVGHSKNDLLGRALEINFLGKIAPTQ